MSELEPIEPCEIEQDWIIHIRGLHLQMINALGIPLLGRVEEASPGQEEITRAWSQSCAPILYSYIKDLTMQDLHASQYAAQGKRYPSRRKINTKRRAIVQRKLSRGKTG